VAAWACQQLLHCHHLLLLVRPVHCVLLALLLHCRCGAAHRALLWLLRALLPFPCADALCVHPWLASGGCPARVHAPRRLHRRLQPPLLLHLLGKQQHADKQVQV
jgi:hypothetical protein